MQRYGNDENLDEYEDDFIEYEDDDQDRYEDEDEEYDEEEEKEEPMSEEAIKYLELRERLKAKHRSLLRRENGKNGVNVNTSKLSNFGSFFGPSKPVIADRVIQESKSLLETRHLAPKVSTNHNDANNKVSMPSTTASNNGPRNNPPPRQVKSKAQIMKQTRDYSFLLSDDAEFPKPAKDPGPPKSSVAKPGLENGRSTQVQAKMHEPSSHSRKNGYDEFEKRKPPSGISQAHDARSAPPPKLTSANRASLPCDSRRQLELRKQPQPNKQVGGSSGSGSRPAVQKALPPKKPSSSSDRKTPVSSSDRKTPVSSSDRKTPVSSSDRRMPVSSSDRRMPVSSMDRKPSAAPAGNRASVVAKTSSVDRQRVSVVKPHASSVNNRLDHRRDVQRSTENRMLNRETIATSKYQPKQSSQNGYLIKKQTPAGQLRNSSAAFNKERMIKKRKSPESDCNMDFRAEIRKMFGRPLEYHDDFDDVDDVAETPFDELMAEEMRSARIAKKEDDEEFIKIQEEERQEMLRKKAKMRRMNQR